MEQEELQWTQYVLNLRYVRYIYVLHQLLPFVQR